MESANKPPVKTERDPTFVEFLPDADEIERRPLPRYTRLTIHTLAALMVFLVVWAALAEVDQVVTARGRLVTRAPNLVVQPLETSIIRSIDVRAGQVVRKGDRLATLDPTFAEADQAQLEGRHRSLDIQISQMEAELAGAPVMPAEGAGDAALQARLTDERRANYRAQAARIDGNLARLRASLQTNRRDQQMLEDRVAALRETEQMQESLAEQRFAPRSRYLDAKDRRLEVERDLTLARNREQEIRRELASAEAEREGFANAWRQKLMEEMLAAVRERDSLAEQIRKGGVRRSLVTLNAPADAVVLEVAKLSQGSVAREAEALFTLVPLGSELEAEVQVDSLNVGYLKAGDPARVKFDAFPFQRHGTLAGTVATISEDAFRREGAAPKGSDAYYVTKVRLGSEPLRQMSAHARLLPGMTLSAEISVGKRSVLSYLVWPLTKGLGEAIREP